MALVTTPQLTARLGSCDPADAAAIIAGVTAGVKAYLGFDPEATGYTDFLNPTGGPELVLLSAPPTCPVTVTSVWEDAARVFGSDTLLVADEDYRQDYSGAFKTCVLIRLGRNWPFTARRYPDRLAGLVRPETGTVKVAYTVDVSGVLAVAKRAALMECLAQANAGATGIGVVTSDSMDGASVSVSATGRNNRKQDSADGFVSPITAGLLTLFRRIPLG